LAIWACRTVSAISPITVKGSKLYDENGKQFYLKGVQYLRWANDEEPEDLGDPLLDGEQCEIDAELLKELGANTIRVYGLTTDDDHDDCMKAFADAGIYVWLDLYPLGGRIEPITPEWTKVMFDEWTRTMDNFAKYDNLLLFTIGDSVIYTSGPSHVNVAPLIKAATQDMKAHRKARGFRPIPLIYISTDLEEVRTMSAEFLACGNGDETIDAYAITVRNWCDGTDFFDRGYDKLAQEFENFHLPVIFLTGCENNNSRSAYPDVKGILGKTFEDIFSGVVVFEWAVEVRDLSLVEY
ncbi:glycolipid anchored surface protein GAS1, partial [Sarocladium strictum]